MKFFSCLAFLLLALSAAQARKVFRISIPSEKELGILSGFADKHPLDFWSEPVIGTVDVLIPDHLEHRFLRLPLRADVMIPDVDALIAEEKERMAANKNADFFEEYQPLEAIYEFVRDLAASYPSLVSTFVLGTSYEGRQILGLKIRANRGATKEFFFNGGTHSREWVATATGLYMANELITKYGSDANVTTIVNGLDWTIVPVLNPDGYVHTFDERGDRLWRKNRQPNTGSTCIGVDLNRNYPFKWNTGGSSALPCSDSFHGPSANSAPETKAITAYLTSNAARLVGYIDIHAYSQLLMYPWGYSTTLTADNAAFKRVGENAAAALSAVYGTKYDVGSIANIIYVASGSSVDYAYGQHGIKWAFAYELRDTGRYGFLLPADQIIPTGIETFESLKVIALQGPLSS